MERLQSILQLLTRPIEFASRDAYAHLSTVKDLGPFVSRQVVQALAETVYPARVETDLLALRQLFTDYDEVRDLAERKRRLAGARAILDRLGSATFAGKGREAIGDRGEYLKSIAQSPSPIAATRTPA